MVSFVVEQPHLTQVGQRQVVHHPLQPLAQQDQVLNQVSQFVVCDVLELIVVK